MSIAESLWTSRICLCSHNQVFIFGITNEAVVNDAVINPSQINVYAFNPYQHLYHSRKSNHSVTQISADDSQIAVFFVIVCDIMHPVNLSFYPWPKGRSVRRWKVAFRTCNHLVMRQAKRRWLGWDLRLAPGFDPIKIHNLIRIYDIADRAAKHRNVTHGYMLILWGTRDGWFMGQDDLSTGKLYV